MKGQIVNDAQGALELANLVPGGCSRRRAAARIRQVASVLLCDQATARHILFALLSSGLVDGSTIRQRWSEGCELRHIVAGIRYLAIMICGEDVDATMLAAGLVNACGGNIDRPTLRAMAHALRGYRKVSDS